VTILDGKLLAEKIQAELATKVSDLMANKKITPGLATIRVGSNEASRIYVNRKAKMCEAIGMLSYPIELEEKTTEAELLKQIQELNRDSRIHGILIQLPLPTHISADRVQSQVDPLKDVDGFHPVNVGRLMLGQRGFVPCTPLGILRLLEEYRIPIEGKEAVVLGRSAIVGKPMAQLLLRKNATVTVAHSKTKNLSEVCQRADILVAAIGKPEFVLGEWIKEGAAVIDVGINRVNEKLKGDVQFDEASKRAKWITPVPGGVGPLTIAMLLSNTLEAASK